MMAKHEIVTNTCNTANTIFIHLHLQINNCFIFKAQKFGDVMVGGGGRWRYTHGWEEPCPNHLCF